jgi:fumarate reductase subunit C
MPILYSTDIIQNMDSVLCGWFCLYMVYFMTVLHKNSKSNNRYLLNKHNSIYSMTYSKLNDRILQKLIKDIMSKKIK